MNKEIGKNGEEAEPRFPLFPAFLFPTGFAWGCAWMESLKPETPLT